MFKNNHLAGVLNFRNGGGSVPSIGGVTLASALARVEAAEQALEAARAQAKAAARREGRSVRNLFSESKFVARASAERWTDTARREGEKAGAGIFCRSIDAESRDENSPFRYLARRLQREGTSRPDEMLRYWAALDAAGFQDATRAGDLEEAARIAVAVNRERARKSKGAAIVAAGKRARMSADQAGEIPEPGGLARKIIEAGKRRRGEIE